MKILSPDAEEILALLIFEHVNSGTVITPTTEGLPKRSRNRADASEAEWQRYLDAAQDVIESFLLTSETELTEANQKILIEARRKILRLLLARP